MEEALVQNGDIVSDFLSPAALWLVFALVLGIFAIVSAILLYHWHKYAFDKGIVRRVLTTYFSVSGVFILLLVVSLISLTL